jgi:hypothetical protein
MPAGDGQRAAVEEIEAICPLLTLVVAHSNEKNLPMLTERGKQSVRSGVFVAVNTTSTSNVVK